MARTPPPLRRTLAALLPALLLAGCVGEIIPPGRSARAPLPPPASRGGEQGLAQCAARLSAGNVRYSLLPDHSYGGGCRTDGTVRLLDVGVQTTGLGPMTCPLAANFAAWAQYGVEPAARMMLGSPIVRIETMGTYSCRTIAGSGRMSEHAHGNAVDVSAFLLADGRRISVRGDWHGEDAPARFLHSVRASACKRFRTVLSPDYNADHYDHLHFDMGGQASYCR